MPKNSLKIKASTLKLEFSGEETEIREGYEMTRELIISCFQEQLLAVEAREQALNEDSEAHEQRRASTNTKSLHRVQPSSPSAGIPRPNLPSPAAAPSAREYQPPRPDLLSHVSVALASDLYNKVCVLDRSEFEASILGSALEFEQIGRIYMPHEQKQRFDRFFTLGKVLWRELTAQGRQAVRNDPNKPGA